jgi:hypothetical protein
MTEQKEQYERGRFEGDVMARLDAIVESHGEIKQIFSKHSEADDEAFADLGKRVGFIERWMWRLIGAAGVLGVLFSLLAPKIGALIHFGN